MTERRRQASAFQPVAAAWPWLVLPLNSARPERHAPTGFRRDSFQFNGRVTGYFLRRGKQVPIVRTASAPTAPISGIPAASASGRPRAAFALAPGLEGS